MLIVMDTVKQMLYFCVWVIGEDNVSVSVGGSTG
jgi:hypothetical protein